jgi:hypothetical protein
MSTAAICNPAPTVEAVPVGEEPVRIMTQQCTDGEQPDIENQVKNSETTEMTETLQAQDCTEVIYSSEPRYIYVQEPEIVYDSGGADPNPGMTGCAMCGCLFSWIPIVGCITFMLTAMRHLEHRDDHLQERH